jgi:hypothetical protein
MKSKTKIHHGDLVITKENQNNYKDITEVLGSVDVREGATFTAPALVEVSGYVDVREGATFTAPALVEVSGYVYVREGATFTAPALAKSGYVEVQQGATFTAPALVEVSGYVYVYEGATFTAPALVAKNGILKIKNKELQITQNDGVVFYVETAKTSKGIKISTGAKRVWIENGEVKEKIGYMAEKDGFTAHGDTLKLAVSDLQFKLVAEKLKNEPIHEDTEITVMHYRTITGACDSGCRDFMHRNEIPYKIEGGRTVEVAPIKAKDLLPILQKSDAYGYQKFSSLVTF